MRGERGGGGGGVGVAVSDLGREMQCSSLHIKMVWLSSVAKSVPAAVISTN